ncbi:hypothetical protein JRO89_XS11G0027600 [Xanthoceras sorbifolium]|uniref:Uncharacterized protein n=1 Tax=Xanthoceras sorbifolium TaxID=99658 RepID=A0ABQ8HEH6_9ROSI|nr:hypothetical protein JRO89_XS11G0027600 [Xanthoceras sorbifolium]
MAQQVFLISNSLPCLSLTKSKFSSKLLWSNRVPSSLTSKAVNVNGGRVQACLAGKTSQEISRPLANFPSNIWKDSDAFFASAASRSFEFDQKYGSQIKELEEKVKEMLVAPTDDLVEKVSFINLLCRLGVSYLYEDEIDQQLIHILALQPDLRDTMDYDLYTVSLLFRVFRQYGYKISSGVFDKFKEDGRFKETLTSDARGMLSLYEATHLRVHGEDILEEALAFSKAHLKSLAEKSSPHMAKQILKALDLPMHKDIPRLETLHFISIYGEEESRNETLLLFAKLDFNRVQLLHQQEIAHCTRINMIKMKDMVRAYHLEAEWLNKKYDPTFDEYWSNALKSAGCFSFTAVTFAGMGDIAGPNAFEWLQSRPKTIKGAYTVGRLIDDIKTHEEFDRIYGSQIKELEEKVTEMLIAPTNDVVDKVSFINSICRLGVSYLFEDEIDQQLNHILAAQPNLINEMDYDLHTVSLLFRVFRQHGYKISCDVFNKFKEDDGRFKETLTSDAKGMLSLYEATHLRLHGEDILEEALAFSKAHLKSLAEKSSPHMAKQILKALDLPMHKDIPRLDAIHYLSIYGEDESSNETLLLFAKLDFNRVQLLHQQEITQVTRWDTNTLDGLPDYMKILYNVLFNLFEEIGNDLTEEERSYRLPCAIETLKEMVRSYQIQAEWFNQGYVPTFDEYMGNALVATGSTAISASIIVGMGESAGSNAFEWIRTHPKILKATYIVIRLLNDIKSNEPTAVPMEVLLPIATNGARVAQVAYKENDGYTDPKYLKNCIAQLFIEPMPI